MKLSRDNQASLTIAAAFGLCITAAVVAVATGSPWSLVPLAPAMWLTGVYLRLKRW